MRPLRKSEKQWLFPAWTLQQTPSQEAGMTYEQELQKRALTIDYIRSLAMRVELHAEIADEHYPELNEASRAKGVLTLAATMVHRFYMRRAIQDFPPEIMAATILFIASKIEEEPLKLRHIVNACLAKFDRNLSLRWEPTGDHGPPPSAAYQSWERDILIVEELTHEALCFDMIVDQPWPVLYRGVQGLDALWTDQGGPPSYLLAGGPEDEAMKAEPVEDAEEGEVEEKKPEADLKKGRVTESRILTLGWAILHTLYMFPLPILYHPNIIAFACFRITMKLLLPDDETMPSCLDVLADRFGLEATPSAKNGDEAGDMELVEACTQHIREFAAVDLQIKGDQILRVLWDWVADDPHNPPNTQKRFLSPQPSSPFITTDEIKIEPKAEFA